MASGPQTTISLLNQKLQRRWVPKWYVSFAAAADGGFHERLGIGFQPIKTGQRRLLTQCRQLAVYAHAVAEGNTHFSPQLPYHLDFIMAYYKGKKKGSWLFARDDRLENAEEIYDLYAHGFVIFALAHYDRAIKDGRARDMALETLSFVRSSFVLRGVPGFAEALGADYLPVTDGVRRHESHMHFLEACLFAYDVFGDKEFLEVADDIVDLFRNYFYQLDQHLLSEYYDFNLNPVSQGGNIIKEPGHYCEWIWLLKKHAAIKGDSHQYDDICRSLLDWANAYGWDSKYGGIYDELNADNDVITDTKRIWPFSEALKANALMLDSGVDKEGVKNTISMMVDIFNAHYMDERGFWTEWLSRELLPQTDYMPGTTPYHVYFGITESLQALRLRGESKSLRIHAMSGAYNMRRSLSDIVRKARDVITKDS